MDRSQDAAGWNAGQVVGATELSGECVAIGAGRSAGDAVLMMARLAGGGFPRPVVGHRALDAEDAAVVVGDDQEERRGRRPGEGV
jgi:hypothetical protein